jgi:UDP-GlcNAc:undecaprenyl-phosphate GlcNAc-1-phosphate transferase
LTTPRCEGYCPKHRACDGETVIALVWLALGAFGLAVLLTMLIKSVALAAGVVAVPNADRWHRGRVPLLGGVAISGAVLLIAAIAPGLTSQSWSLLVAGAVLAAVGLVDDVRPIRPQTKLVAQLVVASGVAGSGLTLGLTQVPALDQLMTVIWLVGLSNAFNLLDNMDGLAAGIGLIAAAFRMLFFLQDGNFEGAALAAILCGALAGFLVFNVQPASVFMGDTGSLFIGFMVGGLSVLGPYAYSRGTFSVVLLPVLILLVPIFDTMFVTIARTLAGRSVARGGRDHTSHRLVALGLSERGAVLMLWAIAGLSGLIAVLSYRYGLSYTVTLVGLLVVGVLVLAAQLGRLRMYPEGADEPPRVALALADFQFKRQVATVIVDTLLIVIAYYTAYLLRFEGRLQPELPLFARSLLIVLVCQLAALASFRTYQDLWRYAGLHDLVNLVRASTVGTAAAVLALVFLDRFEGYSRALFIIDWLLLTGLLAASRLSFRAVGELLARPRHDAVRTLVYGAGAGGVMVLREARTNRALEWHVVGFLDDDRHKRRSSVHGAPVLGGIEQLPSLLAEHKIDQVVISTASISAEHREMLRRLCADAEVDVFQASLHLAAEPRG